MTWLVLAGVVIYFLTRGGRRAPAPSPAATPATAATPASAHLAPVPPPPPPPGATVTIVTDSTVSPTSGDEAAVRASEQARREDATVATATVEQLNIPVASIPPALLAVVHQGGSANETELLNAAEEARNLGRTDLFNYFMGRVQARREYAAASHERPPAPRTVPGVPVASVQPSALPTARASREELFQLAQRVADSIRRSGHRAYDRALLKTFQRKAGLGVDGDYGRQSAQALGHYGRFPAGQVPAPQY